MISGCKGTNIIIYRHYIYWLIIYQFRRKCLKNVKYIPLLDYFVYICSRNEEYFEG